MRFLRDDLHTLTGVYALNAVELAERDRFEHHLRRCKPCSNEVRGLAETATGLAMAAAMAPPVRLRQRVLNAAAVTRQEAPAARRQRRYVPRSGQVPRLAAAVAAVSLAVAVTLGAVDISTQHQLDAAQAQNQAVTAVLTAPDAQIVTRATADGGTATIVASRAKQEIIVTTAGLPALPAAKVYELWLLGPSQARRAGLLPAPTAGKTAPLLASGLQAGDKVGLTVEPAGGTSTPTTTPILIVSLAA